MKKGKKTAALTGQIKKRFLDMKIRKKILLVFLLVVVFPFLGYITTSNSLTRSLVSEREYTLTENALSQAVKSVDNKLRSYNTLSNYMYNNTAILPILNTSYGTDYFRMYKAYHDTIEPLFQTYMALHPNLRDITIYSSCDIHPYMNYIRKLSDFTDLEWYPLVAGNFTPTWVFRKEDGKPALYSARLIGSTIRYRSSNYLCLEVDYASLFEPFSALAQEGSGILVIDDSRQLIYATSEKSAAALDELLSEESSARYFSLSSRIPETNWNVYYYKFRSSITEYADRITRPILAFSLLILLLLIVTMLSISVSVIRPLEMLTTQIQKARVDHIDQLAVGSDSKRRDEIGILFQSFSHMLEDIHLYIEKNLKNELEKKTYQQKILYAQINPHFLYNALSLINSQAILSGQDEISHMVLLLSTFYRTALNQGKDITTLENELLGIQSYIQIQQLSYSEPIDVSWEIDESLSTIPFPNFILQPLVENALDHGLKNSRSPHKSLTISIVRETTTKNDKAADNTHDRITIRILDNGIGMSEETVRSLFDVQTNGYGIKNVNDRLRLLYGTAFSLTIKSQVGKGTLILLQLPLTQEYL